MAKQLFKVKVVTGDQFGAGTDATVKIVLYDGQGNHTPETTIDHKFHNDFERGATDSFKIQIPENLNIGKIEKIEFWKEGLVQTKELDRWYVDEIKVKDKRTKEISIFPILRWIKLDRKYVISQYDTSLPQFDPRQEQRETELKEIRKNYVLVQKAPGLPAQVDVVPEDEKFSDEYMRDMAKLSVGILKPQLVAQFATGDWKSFEEILAMYGVLSVPVPTSAEHWQSDAYFAQQRVASLNHELISLCTKVPEKLGVTDSILKPLLEGLTMQQAIDEKRLFIIDLEILKHVEPPNKDLAFPAPIALFFENANKRLLPVAIQLYQDKAEDNPVFLPSDPENVWLLAKMWYSMADAQFHQAVTHLTLSHLLMEGVCVSAHRQLSLSHPVFKLLAPHFLYVIAVNKNALDTLVSPGGTIDQIMSMGAQGTFQASALSIKNWRLDTEGTLPENLRKRGLLDDSVLAYFPYRDDALLIYDVIKQYVTNIINLYYDNEGKIKGDWELQAWRMELVQPKEEGGAGLLGVPGDNGFTTNDQIITTITAVIFMCSAGHAAANFPQYNEYAFPANYPGMMRGTPPTDKSEVTLDDILAAMPDRLTTIKTLVIVTVLSRHATKALGDFEVNYTFDPPAVKIVKEFRRELRRIEKIIQKRNSTRIPAYTYLHPDFIPNSISV